VNSSLRRDETKEERKKKADDKKSAEIGEEKKIFLFRSDKIFFFVLSLPLSRFLSFCYPFLFLFLLFV